MILQLCCFNVKTSFSKDRGPKAVFGRESRSATDVYGRKRPGFCEGGGQGVGVGLMCRVRSYVCVCRVVYEAVTGVAEKFTAIMLSSGVKNWDGRVPRTHTRTTLHISPTPTP